MQVIDATEEQVHKLTTAGVIACKGIHVVAAVRRELGYVVTADPDRVTCPACLAVRR